MKRKLVCVIALLLPTGCLATAPTKPFPSDRDATSCPGDILNLGSPDPSIRQIVAYWVQVQVGKTAMVDACFYRDKVRPEDRAAITWSIGNTDLAILTVSSGPTATVLGKAFGTTTITATITGVPVTEIVRVCESETRCPPLPPGS
jgi:hypothetical protein